jgi:NDP-sugar pyrophosphorylase family protein
MEAVVMAAGEGRRLRPLTERYAKAVLPLDGRPVIVTLLRELAGAGVGPITVVVGHLGEQVERLLHDFDRELVFVRQPEPLGSADAILRAALDPPYVAVAADTAFAPGDIARFVEAASGCDGAIAVRRQPPPGPGRAAVRVEEGRVRRVVDESSANPLAGAPLWLVGPEVHERLPQLPGPPYQLADAFQEVVDAGGLVRGVEIGPTRDLTFPLDLAEQNFSYLRSL